MKRLQLVFLFTWVAGLAWGAGQVRTPDIVDGAVTNPKITSMAGSKITGAASIPIGTLPTGNVNYADAIADFTGKLRAGTGTPAFATANGSFYVTGVGEFAGAIYATTLTGPKLLYVDSSGQFQMVTLGTGLSLSTGTLSASGSGGTVTDVTATSPLASSGGTTPNLTLGTVGITNGGTGQTTKTPAFDALSPTTTLGDLIYGGASGTGTRLAGNTTSAKQFLGQTGTGSVSAAPAWGALVAGDIPTISGSQVSGGTFGAVNGSALTSLTGGNVSGNIPGNAANVTGTVAIGNGGSGQTTAAAAFDALGPTTTNGDIIVRLAGTNARLAKGSDSTVLTIDPTTHLPVWAAPAAGSTVPRSQTKVIATTYVSGPSLSTVGADYICDGTDDQVEFNAAVTALSATGGTIYISEGLYRFGGTVANCTVGSAHVTFIGAGRAATTVQRFYQPTGTTDGPMFRVTAGDVSFRGFTIDGNRGSFNNANGTGIAYNASQTRSFVDDMSIINCQGLAIGSVSFSATQCWFDRNYIFNSANEGIWFGGSTTNCWFTDNTLDTVTWGIRMGAGGKNLVKHNYIITASQNAIYQDSCNSNQVVENSIASSGAQSIYVSNSTEVQVIGNNVRSSTGVGIYATSNDREQVNDNTIVDGSASAITASATTNSSFSNNVIKQAAANGISLSTTTDSVVSGNKIWNVGGSGSFDGIILTGGGSVRNIVTNNSITDTAGTGFAIHFNAAGDTQNILSNNYFSGTGAASISDSGTANRWVGQWDGTNLVTSGVQSNNAGLGLGVTATKTSAYTALVTDTVVLCDPTGGTFQVTLPTAAAGNTGKVWLIKNVSASATAITVAGASGNIDGSASLSITSAYGTLRVFSSGSALFTMP